MSDLKFIDIERFGRIRTTKVDGEGWWFLAEDIIEILGVSKNLVAGIAEVNKKRIEKQFWFAQKAVCQLALLSDNPPEYKRMFINSLAKKNDELNGINEKSKAEDNTIIDDIKKKGQIKNGMIVSIIDLTPQIAKSVLELNTKNRNLSSKTAAKYALDMLKGNWKQNCVPIVIGLDGVLKDGQHRLAACIRSGVTLYNTIIAFQSESQTNCYDINKIRSVKDIATLENYSSKNHKNVAIIGAIQLILESITTSSYRNVTKMDVLNGITKYYDSCTFARENILEKAKSRTLAKLKKAPVIAAIIKIHICESNSTELKKFCEILVSGMAHNPYETQTIRLRDYLLSYNVNSSFKNRKELMATVEVVYKNFLARKECKNLRLATTPIYSIDSDIQMTI